MTLRFAADRRALIWSLLLFPALPSLAFFRPMLAPWLLPLGLYLAYCSGVLAHNHQHTPVFRSLRANSVYSAWLSFFYGCPVFVWLPTHNQNHHRYSDGPGDVARTPRPPSCDTLFAALSYPTRSARAQWPVIWRYVAQQRRRDGRRFRQIILEAIVVGVGHPAALALAVGCYGLGRGALLYCFALGIPAGFAAWAMMFTNYLQHVGCDPRSPDNHSRNFVSPLINWFVFQAGYHTVHHERSLEQLSVASCRSRCAHQPNAEPADDFRLLRHKILSAESTDRCNKRDQIRRALTRICTDRSLPCQEFCPVRVALTETDCDSAGSRLCGKSTNCFVAQRWQSICNASDRAAALGRVVASKGVTHMLTILLIVLLLAIIGGGFGHSRYGYVGWSPAGILLVILLVYFFTGHNV